MCIFVCSFEPQIRQVVQKRDMPGREQRQTLMFSATFPAPIQKLAGEPPPSRTKWTRRVPHPVLIGHAASRTPY